MVAQGRPFQLTATGFVCSPGENLQRRAPLRALVELKNRGMVVSELSRQERDKMVEKVKPVYDKNLAAYGKEGPNLVFEALKKIRAN